MTNSAITCPSSPSGRVSREGDEVDVRAVEHQFDAHQHADAVPLGRHADHAADEQHRADHQKQIERNASIDECR